MRLGLLIKDIEYRKALTERISEYDGDIILDVIGTSDSIEHDALILTDAKPAELGTDLIEKIKDRTIVSRTGTEPQPVAMAAFLSKMLHTCCTPTDAYRS